MQERKGNSPIFTRSLLGGEGGPGPRVCFFTLPEACPCCPWFTDGETRWPPWI